MVVQHDWHDSLGLRFILMLYNVYFVKNNQLIKITESAWYLNDYLLFLR